MNGCGRNSGPAGSSLRSTRSEAEPAAARGRKRRRMIPPTGQAGNLAERFRGRPPENVLAWALSEHRPHIALASSFSREDIVLIAMMTDIRAGAPALAPGRGQPNEQA